MKAALLKMGVGPGVNVAVGMAVLVGVDVAVAVVVQAGGVAPPTETKSLGALAPSLEE